MAHASTNSLSPLVAVACGLLFVNMPVLIALCGVPILTWFVVGMPHRLGDSGGIGVAISACLGVVVAWGWWSVSVPKWRLWAYRRVKDIVRLNRYAVAAGVIWPRGHPLERTEIKSGRHKALEEAFERQAGDRQ